jgi:hypothetical protein
MFPLEFQQLRQRARVEGEALSPGLRRVANDAAR